MRIPVLFGFLISCSELDVQLAPPAPVAELVSVQPEAVAPPSVRFAIDVSIPLLNPRIEVIAGGASEEDVSALAKNRPTAALRAREIATTLWIDGSVFAQPIVALPLGRNTLIVLQDKRAPLVHELVVEAGPTLPTRTWTSEKSVTYCGKLPSGILLQPGNVPTRIVPRGPCFEVLSPIAIAGLVLPPEIDPAPIGSPEVSGAPEPPCPELAYPVGPLCVRVDDDRLVLLGGVATRRLVIGSVGKQTIAEAIPLGARRVVRGLPALESVTLDLFVRDASREQRVKQTIVMRPPRRHAVINEVLVKPPSGATSQRFVELVNDGDGPLDLVGLILRDGDATWELPDTILPPGAFALITPATYIDGLGGEPAPPKGVDRITVDALKLNNALTLEERDGTVLSQFPGTTSTRIAARIRRTPDTPDDAPDAFVYAAPTPGRSNVLP
jgi:hypothetical protein